MTRDELKMNPVEFLCIGGLVLLMIIMLFLLFATLILLVFFISKVAVPTLFAFSKDEKISINNYKNPKNYKEKIFNSNNVEGLISKRLLNEGFENIKINFNGQKAISHYKMAIVNEFRRDKDLQKIPTLQLWTLDTKINVFFIITKTDSVTKQDIKDFSNQCCEYALKNKKGLPRGLNSGVMSIAMVLSNSIENDAMKWVQTAPPKHLGLFELPVIYDLTTGIFYHYDNSGSFGKKIYPYGIRLVIRTLSD